ncbi:acetamidase/formamidase family protein (plasmid) [Haloferacaceae archaeon DSL9]
MQTIDRDNATKYEFGRDMEPLLTVEPGESFRVETWDAFEGTLFDHGLGEFTVDDVPGLQAPPPAFDGNPLAGPVYIDGVERGDTLAVTVEEIRPERGMTTTLEEFGCLAGRSGWEECQVNLAHEVELEPGPSGTTADGTARMELGDHEWTWDLNPHIGTIATAPGRTVQDSVTSQGPWGGNMDVRDLTQGSTVYLRSFNEGGLLFVGDVHASQSDSEYTGIAVESIAEIVLSVEVVDTPVPGVFRIEDDESLIHVDSSANAGTLEDAINSCFEAMMTELVTDYGLGKREAYVQMSLNPAITVRLYQFVHPGFATVGVKLDKSFLDQFSDVSEA